MGCGIAGLQRPAAAASAPAVASLQAAGAHAARHCSTQPLNAPTLGSNIRNPGATWRAAGGGCRGAAVAVARGEADLGVGSDLLGSVRLPAACMGLCSYVPSPGALGAWEEGGAATQAAEGGRTPVAAEGRERLPHSGLPSLGVVCLAWGLFFYSMPRLFCNPDCMLCTVPRS